MLVHRHCDSDRCTTYISPSVTTSFALTLGTDFLPISSTRIYYHSLNMQRLDSATGYKLTYFDLRGRGETARMLFKLGNRPFEDNRVAKEDWPQLKPSKCNLL